MTAKSNNEQIVHEIFVGDNDQGIRLDVMLAKHMAEYSRARLQSWIKQGFVTVDGQLCQPKDKLKAEQIIKINAPKTIETYAQPQPIDLNIIHEDEALIVINKPAGLVVHPGAGNPNNTLMNALLHHCPDLEQLPRAGIIHRLDKETSGLLIVPKTLTSHHALSQQIQNKTMSRHYLALVQGKLIAGGSIDAPIGRHPQQRTRMAVVDQGKPATTHYRIKERFQHYTLLNVQLETGRTHQIRVHCQHIRHPIVGDPVYQNRMTFPKNADPALLDAIQHFRRQALHAYKLEVVHPNTQQKQQWHAPLPDDFETLLATLRTYDSHDPAHT